MEKLNELMSKACLASELGKKGITVDLQMLSQVRDEVWAINRRAEAAEAKLAELKKQKPYGYVAESPCSSGYGGMMHEFSIDRRDAEHDANQAEGFVIDLFTRPAPAAELAELVPDAKPKPEPGTHASAFTHWHDGWNACRAAILRNIEEAKK